MKFRVHFEYFPVTSGIASCIKFWYSPKGVHTRRDAEHLKRPYKKLLKKRTSKKLAKVQRTCRELASRAVYALLGWRERFGLGVHAARFHTNSLTFGIDLFFATLGTSEEISDAKQDTYILSFTVPLLFVCLLVCLVICLFGCAYRVLPTPCAS